ncbi:MAG TPA: efflux RND transporter periplasmic adaptor subunit [Candidatus Eremiobacteraceae bacterium]
MDEPTTLRTTLALTAALALLSIAGCSNHHDSFAYSGTVQADSAAVGSTAGGRVTRVAVSDGQRVGKGQTIIAFDDRQLRAAYLGAIAARDQAYAQLHDLEAGPRSADIAKAEANASQADAAYEQARVNQPQAVQAARSGVDSAKADDAAANAASVKATRDEERSQALFQEGAISAQAMDASRAAADSARGAAQAADARLRQAIAQLDSVEHGSAAQTVNSAADAAAAAHAEQSLVLAGTRPDQLQQAKAAARVADANVAAAAARLDEARVAAPADGVVDGLDLRPGDLVAAGAAVAQVDEFGDPWVRIYVTQSDMQNVKVGAAVRVRSDALAGRTFDGHIETIDAQAQFTPRDVQTAEDRADLAFGVKVRIADPGRALRAGTTVDVALP